MKLTSIENNIAEDRKHPFLLVKGKNNTGKSTIAACRSIFLKNNYCISSSDKILIINNSKQSLNKFNNIYSSIYDDANFKYSTLLAPEKDVIEISTLDDVMDRYLPSNLKLVDEKETNSILKSCIDDLKKLYPNIKVLNDTYIEFLKDEIQWIKSCGYNNLDVYQNIARTGRNLLKKHVNVRLNKNSNMRKCIFELMLMYNDKLNRQRQFDTVEKIKAAIKNSRKSSLKKYTHIIVDGIENLTKLHVDFINSIRKNSEYSTTLFTYNNDLIENSTSWFINKKNIRLVSETKIKSYTLKNSYKNENTTIPLNSLEKFTYKDIKHKTSFEFIRDNYDTSKIILTGNSANIEYGENEIEKIPIFNEIAAGEPILINSQIEDKFYLPRYWVKDAKNCFILKIKGDSMINADINDGDCVVIKKTGAAENRDIVAVNIDGSATLKRLKMDKDGIAFMPENELYSPIKVTEDEQVMLIGIAVGVLKSN